MPKAQIIAIDAMGGDFGPSVTIPAASMALKALKSDIRFTFFGDSSLIEPVLSQYPELEKCSSIEHTDKVISSTEKPSVALRQGKGSSMRLAIDAVKNGAAGSVVSAGNTGALMATAKMVLKCLPGINRPAIASVMPTRSGDTIMLDLGANITCDSEILVQFAVLGAVYARAVKGLTNPAVGLLNVGSEEMKGHDQLRSAYSILSNVEFPGKFYGFVEGNDIALGTVDVVVTDGFTGNIALKVAEGVGLLTADFLKQELKSSPLAVIGALFAYGALKRLKARMDPRFYNGGMFLGLDGICVKSHGGMDAYGFSRAICVAANLVDNGYNRRVAHELEQLMSQESFFSGVSHNTAES
jgi:glycerol-3-phosphate acyltransferase PlsX